MQLKEKLVSLRKENGLSQMDLAEKIHVSRQAVSRWEGGLAVPSTDNLKFLSNLYHVSVDVLLNDSMNLSDEDDFALATAKQVHGKRSKRVVVAIFILAILATALICTALFHEEGKNEIIPIEEMKSDTGDDMPTESFTIGW